MASKHRTRFMVDRASACREHVGVALRELMVDRGGYAEISVREIMVRDQEQHVCSCRQRAVFHLQVIGGRESAKAPRPSP